jgi:hypothetical protein
MKIKKKLLFSPLAILIMIIVFGVGVAGAAIYFGGVLNTGTQTGPVGWWKLNGNAKDSSPNSNHGTVTGAVPTTDRKGEVNKAYQFNGTTDNIEVPDSNSLDPTGSVSVEGWVYEP